jgi:hypothetical protein
MGTDVVSKRDRLTDRERQILEHLEQAQSLSVPLSEYASDYGVDVCDLYAGKAQLVKKGVLARTSTPERSDLEADARRSAEENQRLAPRLSQSVDHDNV